MQSFSKKIDGSNSKDMSTADIHFRVHLDKQKVPQKIFWQATDVAHPTLTPTRAMSLSTWDHKQKNTLRIDLWTKDMSVVDMQSFVVDIIGSLGQSVLKATGDTVMAQKIIDFCHQLTSHIKKTTSQTSNESA